MNTTRLIAFAAILAVTLAITVWASRRTSTQNDFYVAGRGISARQNGLAISGDLMSAATFLGFTGLIYLNGFDGWVLALAAIFAFVIILLLLAERMRNAGQFTVADVLAFRLSKRPIRAAVASSTLIVVVFYLIAQLVGAGILLRALTGLNFTAAVLITGSAMLAYVVLGGMIAATWVQIIKAVLLLSAGLALTVFILARFNFNPLSMFQTAAAKHELGQAYLGPGGSGQSGINTISAALAYAIGTAALPHILIRFFTVPTAKEARGSAGWAIGIIGAFFIGISIIGFGARAILPADIEDSTAGGNLAAPLLAEYLGGGSGTVGGDLFMAVVSAVAFATILAVVAGLLISAAGAVSHDLWSNVVRFGRETSDREGTRVARLASLVVGAVAITATLALGDKLNVALLVGLAMSVAASANFPALVLALTWKSFNTTGAIAGIVVGLVSSLVLILIGPYAWPAGPEEAPLQLNFPVLITIPLAFLACWIGTVVGRRRAPEDRAFDVLHVRSMTGYGAAEAHPH